MERTKILRRIKYQEPLGSSLDTKLLNDLCMAFVSTIPFENLDVIGGVRRSLIMEDIHKRLILEKRGGCCCELNALFHWLLSSLGFNVDMCHGNGVDEETDTFRNIADHMVLIVSLQNGEKWLTDVGWGGTSFVLPLNLEKLGVEQIQPNGVYKIKLLQDRYIVEKKKQTQIRINGEIIERNTLNSLSKHQTSSDWSVLYGFTLQSHPLKHFVEGFNYAQESHPFTTKNSCAVLQDSNGRTFLIGNTLVEKQYIDPMTVKVRSVQKYDVEEMKKVLRDKFDLTVDFGFEPKANLHWTGA